MMAFVRQLRQKDHFIRYRIDRDPDLTYVIGARCKDGILIISDSRVTRGNDVNQAEKIIRPIDNAIVGAAGTTALFSKFLRQIDENIKNQEIKTWSELINIVEDITLKLNQRYIDRTREATEVLMAIQDVEGDAKLYFVSPQGVAEEVKRVSVIGHGEPYGALLLKTMWKPDMTMRETAEIATFILTLIQVTEVDNSVDADPQIWYVPFDGEIHRSDTSDTGYVRNRGYFMSLEFNLFLLELLKNPKVDEMMKQRFPNMK